MKQFRTLDDVDVKGKRVLLRVDLNVPMENGRVSDLTRLERVAPTILEISSKGGRAILLSHFGRPKGRDPKESLKPVAVALAPPIMGYGQLGGVTHHVALAVFAVGAWGAGGRAAFGSIRSGILLGLFAGFGIWLSPEALPFGMMASFWDLNLIRMLNIIFVRILN